MEVGTFCLLRYWATAAHEDCRGGGSIEGWDQQNGEGATEDRKEMGISISSVVEKISYRNQSGGKMLERRKVPETLGGRRHRH